MRWAAPREDDMSKMRLLTAASALALTVGVIGMGSADAQQMQERTLRVAQWGEAPGRGNPYTGSGTPSVFYWHALFDSLTFIDEKGKAVPALATSWRNVTPTTWEFKLRPNTKFHNGVTNTPEAMIAAISWLKSDEGKAKGPSVSSRVTWIADVKRVDDTTLTIETVKPNPITPNDISAVFVPEPKAWTDLAAFTQKPVGTGSYRIVDWQAGIVKFTAAEDSWRRPKIRNLEISAMPERPTRLAAFQSNQLDAVLGLTPDNVPAIRAMGANLDIQPGQQVLTWAFTHTNAKEGVDIKPFLDKRVRQAANYAVNKEALAQGLLGGTGGIAMGQGVSTLAYGHNPNVKPYPQDIDRAKRLMSEAGYPNGLQGTVVVEAVPGAFPADGEIFQQTATDLKRIGINAEVRVIQFPQWLPKFFQVQWDGPMWHNLWGAAPAMDATAAILNQSCLKGGKPYICDPQQQALYDQASTEFDEAKRLKTLHDLIALQHEEAINLFLVQFANLHATQRNVAGFKNVNQFINYHEMSFTN
jgi:peptide/nickel transport system substrate-binding protein